MHAVVGPVPKHGTRIRSNGKLSGAPGARSTGGGLCGIALQLDGATGDKRRRFGSPQVRHLVSTQLYILQILKPEVFQINVFLPQPPADCGAG